MKKISNDNLFKLNKFNKNNDQLAILVNQPVLCEQCKCEMHTGYYCGMRSVVPLEGDDYALSGACLTNQLYYCGAKLLKPTLETYCKQCILSEKINGHGYHDHCNGTLLDDF